MRIACRYFQNFRRFLKLSASFGPFFIWGSKAEFFVLIPSPSIPISVTSQESAVLKRSRTALLILCLLVLGASAQAASTYWAGTSAGLIKSTDGGLTWQPVTVTTSNSLLQGTFQIATIAVDPQQPATIYFIGNSNAVGFFRSNDAGKTWTGITVIGVALRLFPPEM
jgi:hypothetical protein